MPLEAESSLLRKSPKTAGSIEMHGLWCRTNGAAGVIPATLKYVTEFISQDPERECVYCILGYPKDGPLIVCSIMTFLLTASGE